MKNANYRVHTHNLECMGQGKVDLLYGNLMFEAVDFQWEGNRMPLSVKHLFDTNDMNQDAGLGKGWKLNLMQKITSEVFTHEGTEYEGYIFQMEDGEELKFKMSDRTAGNNLNPYYHLYEEVNDSEIIFDPVIGILQIENDYYMFDANGALVMTSDEDGNSMSIMYENGKLASITDAVGRSFQCTYDTNGYLASITAPGGAVTTYSYTGNLLTGISWPGGKNAVIQYESGRPVAVILKNEELEDVYKVVYEYSGNTVSKVTEYGVNAEGLVKGVSTVFEYSMEAGRTVVATVEPADVSEGETEENITKNVYTFDNEGTIISEYVYIEELGNVGTQKNITPQSNDAGIVYNNNNLLTEHAFRRLANWYPMEANEEDFTVLVGKHELEFPYHKEEVSMESVTNSIGCGICQETGVLPAGDYTFSAYVRPNEEIVGTAKPGCYIRVADTDGNVLVESEYITESLEYVRLVETFELAASQAVQVQILMNGTGKVFVNAPQLENNPVANAYNLLENGNFANGAAGWSTRGVSVVGEETFNGEYALKIAGNLDSAKYAYQNVSVKEVPSTRENFTLSGWAKGYGLLNSEQGSNAEPLFRLRAILRYADTVEGEENEEEFIADFSPDTEEWQFTSVQIEKSKYRTVDYVRVYCEYSYNRGNAYFDDIQLTRNSIEWNLTANDFETELNVEDEETGENEEDETIEEFEEAKDNYGNIITETLFNEAETDAIYRSFGYSGNGNDLVRETDSRGNNTTYVVDSNTSRTTQITDRCGNKTDFEYDAAGRTTKVRSKKANGTEVANVSYSYDTFDNMTEIVRGDGMKYALEYNAFHNLESIGVQGKAEKLVSYTYKDGNGRLKEVAYANGDVLKITYNRLGQVSSEKWYNAADVLTAHYKYSYDNQDNVVRSIDLLNKKEYDYLYDEDRIIRATQCDITLNEAGMVVSKSISSVVVYRYDSEERLAYKQIISSSGTEQTRIYTTTEDDETKVEFLAGRFIAHSISETDELGRKKFEKFHVGMLDMYRDFTYHTGQVTAEHTAHNKVKGAATTDLVSQITLRSASGGTYKTLSYEYDNEERITKVIDSVDGTTEYTYDSLGQLLTEKVNDVIVNSMTYDNYGNILTKNGISYTYGDNAWKDKLTAYNGQAISYDAQGNPTSYLGHNLAWEKGRQLKSFDNISYTYDANGIRTSKTVNGVKHTYVLEGANILEETWGDNELIPMYDNEENVCGIIYNGEPYCFRKNLQGDIISITDFSGQEVAKYSYDAWGVCTILVDASDDHIASVNPYRYRGYYFDVETGLYYLQSRYYDPVIGRFVNGDDFENVEYSSQLLAYNLFTYCDNDLINTIDKEGKAIWKTVAKIALGVLAQYAGDIIGNIIKGKTGKSIFTDISSIGTYISAGITSLFKGGKILKNVSSAFVSTVIKAIEKGIKKKKISIRKLLKDFFKNMILGIIGDFISEAITSKIMSLTPKNYSKFAHSQYLKNAQITPNQIRTKMRRKIKAGLKTAGAFDFLVSAVLSAV